MAHRKVRSLGSVPFSWEEKPGVPKQTSQHNSALEEKPQKLKFSREFLSHFDSKAIITKNIKISPPPGVSCRPPCRSSSLRKLLWGMQDDPFATAIKECTKSIRSYGVNDSTTTSEGNMFYGACLWNKRISLSCKKSCDVKEDSMVVLSKNHHQLHLHHLPPIPRGRKIVGVTW